MFKARDERRPRHPVLVHGSPSRFAICGNIASDSFDSDWAADRLVWDAVDALLAHNVLVSRHPPIVFDIRAPRCFLLLRIKRN